MELALRGSLNLFFKKKILLYCFVLVFYSPLFFCNRLLDDGHCVLQCPKGKFEFQNQCHLCHHSCKECNGSEPNKCTACGTGKGILFFYHLSLLLLVSNN